MGSTWVIIGAGLVGSLAMHATMSLIHRFKWANADMIRAIGSIYTRSYELSYIPGLILHYLSGLVFAFLYFVLLGLFPGFTPGTSIILLTFIGLVHGIVVGLMLEVLVAEHHPLEEFRKAGFPVVVAHVAGHIAYGFVVGLTYAVFWDQIRNSFETHLYERTTGDLIGYLAIWIPLFGPPVLFVGYLLYMIVASHLRAKAHRLEYEQEHKQEQETKNQDDFAA